MADSRCNCKLKAAKRAAVELGTSEPPLVATVRPNVALCGSRMHKEAPSQGAADLDFRRADS